MRDKLKNTIEFWKSIWGKLIAFIIGGSIVALFIASFCMSENLTLTVMNEWVSLVVGMAALILGIISLFLSFYNVEQSNEVQKETVNIMNEVKEDITQKLNEIQINMNNNFSDIKYYNNLQDDSIKDVKTILSNSTKWRMFNE